MEEIGKAPTESTPLPAESRSLHPATGVFLPGGPQPLGHGEGRGASHGPERPYAPGATPWPAVAVPRHDLPPASERAQEGSDTADAGRPEPGPAVPVGAPLLPSPDARGQQDGRPVTLASQPSDTTPPGPPPPAGPRAGESPGGGDPRRAPRGRALMLTGLAILAGAAAGGIGVALSTRSGPAPSAGLGPASGVSQSSVPNIAAGNLSDSEAVVAAVAKKLEPAVVDIDTRIGYGSDIEGEAAGTGMILTHNGEVLTNNHVIEGASSIEVHIEGRSKVYSATVVGVDPLKDVAVIKIEGVSDLPIVHFANSAQLQVGTPVVAIGNAFGLGGTPTVTSGAVTALHRSISASTPMGTVEHLHNMVQIDAALAPGNSGGPLADVKGDVVGMNTAAATESSSDTPESSVVGFAEPINSTLAIATEIEHHEGSRTVLIGARGFLGVLVSTAQSTTSSPGGLSLGLGGTTTVTRGADVIESLPGTPAATLGLTDGDTIVDAAGKRVTSATGLGNILEEKTPGARVSIVWVGPAGSTHSATVRLIAGPAV
jgi:S1-C subfamily serine protease